MTISDHSRHLLHQRLDEVLGPDDAATLMEHLPPVGWADVATKRDLDHLGAVLRAEIAQLRLELKADLATEMGGLRADMARQVPTLFVGMVGLQISGAALVVAASRLL